MRLNDLRDNAGARKPKKRVGRGIGSGSGKTGGRGVKGQKSRSGVAIKGFEGGQMPLHMRLPKRGFLTPNAKSYAEVSLDKLQAMADAGTTTIDEAALREAGYLPRAMDGVRVLGSGELTAKLDLTVTYATKSAREAIEKAGGSVTITRPEKHQRLRGPHKQNA
ncbi:50S ribosomal protein L15 [Parvularcula dongshanensis]|uniref:Large ribosomal subunit protein uL15 n=1 Tax=Parvularcula dongshanensis TaxID=1173995 RepID=A0A840I260_9PROT|nr:50S ribosomal protein L15 [Parvularcula dongshanensis]MBB4658899.1 large subunit ribosomal protein L15 [Parvularcula dongshanensis]